jgi:hypothetical protein
MGPAGTRQFGTEFSDGFPGADSAELRNSLQKLRDRAPLDIMALRPVHAVELATKQMQTEAAAAAGRIIVASETL